MWSKHSRFFYAGIEAAPDKVDRYHMLLNSESNKRYLHKGKQLILQVKVLTLKLEDELSLVSGSGSGRSEITLSELFLRLLLREGSHLPIIL